MRTRQEIETSGTRVDLLMLEVLLDIRDEIVNTHNQMPIVREASKPYTGKPRGRPKKIK